MKPKRILGRQPAQLPEASYEAPYLIEDVTALAKALGITRSAIYGWRVVPAERVVEVERITGISRKRLRPDLYDGMRRG
jgi:DNA-binding transcriptional regulator YdaS (Cro superfamily)